MCADDLLLEECLHAVIRFLCHLIAGLGLLQQLEGGLHLFLARTVLRHLLHSLCGIGSTLSLNHLGGHFGGLDDSQRIAGLHHVALLRTELENTSGHLA